MTLMAHCGTTKISREELKLLPIPEATRTHRPIPHHEIVQALVETLGFRHIQVVRDEYAVSPDGMKMFGVLDLDYVYGDLAFSLGIRNSNNKSIALGITCGYRVFICDNMAFQGDFTPVLKKHTSRIDVVELLSIGVDKLQRNFEPLKTQIDTWRDRELTDAEAKLLIYEAFVERGFPSRLLNDVHQHYFKPAHDDFNARSFWSLSNAFTSSLKTLTPISQFQWTAKLGGFLQEQLAKLRNDRRFLAADTVVQ